MNSTVVLFRPSKVPNDWDVYYKRVRRPEESIRKYVATRSKGYYRRKFIAVLTFVSIRQELGGKKERV